MIGAAQAASEVSSQFGPSKMHACKILHSVVKCLIFLDQISSSS